MMSLCTTKFCIGNVNIRCTTWFDLDVCIPLWSGEQARKKMYITKRTSFRHNSRLEYRLSYFCEVSFSSALFRFGLLNPWLSVQQTLSPCLLQTLPNKDISVIEKYIYSYTLEELSNLRFNWAILSAFLVGGNFPALHASLSKLL